MIILALAFALAAQDPTPPGPVSTPLGQFNRTISDQPIKLPTDFIVTRATLVEIPTGGVVAEHFHPEQRYVYVLSGRLRIHNLETGVTAEFAEGAFIVEPIGQWHEGFAVGEAPVRLLVIDQTEGSPPSNVVSRQR